MTNTDLSDIRARLFALGNVRWRRENLGDAGFVVFAISPSGKTWQVAQTHDGLNKEGVVSAFIAHAPGDIARLLARIDALEAALRELYWFSLHCPSPQIEAAGQTLLTALSDVERAYHGNQTKRDDRTHSHDAAQSGA